MKVSTTSLSSLSSLSILQQRIIRTLRGAFIADAASMGLHWIYNPDDVLDKLTTLHNIKQPEFINPPIPNYYSTKEFPNHYLYGMLSPYGEQLLYITQYISSSIDEKTNPTELDGNTMMNGLYEWGKSFGGRPDHALTTVISNIETAKKEQQEGEVVVLYPNCGADDDQAHFYMKLIPVVCRYISETSNTDSSDTSNDNDDLLLLKNVEISIRIHQNNDIAVAFGIAATRIIQSILLYNNSESTKLTTSSFLQILDTVYENLEIDLKKVFDNNTNMIDETKKDEIIQLVLQSYQRGKTAATEYTTLNDFLLILSNEKMKDQIDNPFYNLAARSCALPGSFIGPMYLFYKIALSNSNSNDSIVIDDNTYINAIRENILAAGDTCSRGIFIGAVLGAAMSTTGTNNNENNDNVVTFDTLWNKVEINTRNEIDLYSTKIAKVE